MHSASFSRCCHAAVCNALQSPTTCLQDIDVESLMQEIRQWNPQDQPAASAAPHADAETQVHRDVEASPSSQGIGLLAAGSFHLLI